jgi:hypothetical protein
MFNVGVVEDFTLFPGGPSARVRRVEHDRFGVLLAPESPADFTAFVGQLAAAWGTAGWRGHASLGWSFDSSLTRRVRTRDSSLGGILGEGPSLARVMRETESRLAWFCPVGSKE